MDEFAVVEDETYPEVVHEDREAGHDGDDDPWATELIPSTQVSGHAHVKRGERDVLDMLVKLLVALLALVGGGDRP